jgi:hypothetical protein
VPASARISYPHSVNEGSRHRRQPFRRSPRGHATAWTRRADERCLWGHFLSPADAQFGAVRIRLSRRRIRTSTVPAAIGVSVFALGAGLTTLVRPHLIQDMADAAGGGYSNGRIARQQQLARAAGPLLVATVASLSNYAAVIIAFAVLFLICATGWQLCERSR